MPTLPDIPKFLFCEPDPDDAEDLLGYVLHTQEPAFLAAFIEHDNGMPSIATCWHTPKNSKPNCARRVNKCAGNARSP